jgi:hypothetical protein
VRRGEEEGTTEEHRFTQIDTDQELLITEAGEELLSFSVLSVFSVVKVLLFLICVHLCSSVCICGSFAPRPSAFPRSALRLEVVRPAPHRGTGRSPCLCIRCNGHRGHPPAQPIMAVPSGGPDPDPANSRIPASGTNGGGDSHHRAHGGHGERTKKNVFSFVLFSL